MMRRAMISGLAGHELTQSECKFLAQHRPLGIILFARNLKSLDQISKLVADARAAISAEDVLVLIDQEGGRVQRLRPPLSRALPPAARYGERYQQDPRGASEAAYLAARLLSEDLTALGINCNCAPVLDIPVPGAHDIIADRAYGTTPQQVTALGRAVAQGFIHGSVVPVIKHIPGHGRANADSHHALPVVDTPAQELIDTDFKPFAALKDIPAAMTAHILYSQLDPHNPASTSPAIIQDIIRQKIGFQGLLMSDDLSMKALGGTIKERASAVIAAGCDVALHCNGNFDEMENTAQAVPQLDENSDFDPAFFRFKEAVEITQGVSAKPYDSAMATKALNEMCAG